MTLAAVMAADFGARIGMAWNHRVNLGGCTSQDKLSLEEETS
jgi:hypothetical protein